MSSVKASKEVLDDDDDDDTLAMGLFKGAWKSTERISQ